MIESMVSLLKPDYSKKSRDRNLLFLFKFMAAIEPIFTSSQESNEAAELFDNAVKPYVIEIISGNKKIDMFFSENVQLMLT